MKLKFRAEPKDFLIFAIFAVVLLYFVSIAVLNLASFATDSTFHGFNPFPAFSKNYLPATLVGYLGALIAIIMSVSSYFFDREKGIGISTNAKKEKGYSRWAQDKEMKKELKMVLPNSENSPYAGIPLINSGKEIWVDDGEYHNLIIGSTGSGKTQIAVLPMVKLLAKKGESMIVTDPKGEIYEGTANMLRQKGYNIVLLNFRDPQRGNAWNPMALPYSLYKTGNKDKANELLDDLAMNILYDEKAQNNDPFWERTSADYFTGLALGLFDDAKEEEINLNSINLMTTMGEEKFAASTYIKEYFNGKDPASSAYINASSTLMAPSETKGSILAVFKQKIKLFSSRENLSEMLGHSDFDMKEIGRKKTAVFIVIQDEKKTYHSLVTIFIKQCYETLIDVAQENGGKLPFRTNFILDEFANMPPLKDVTTMVTAARSRAMRFNFIIQNFSQLNQVYGKENADTIKGNCGNIIYLISSEIAALEEISKMCGEVKSKEKDKTASTPLVTVSDLQRMKPGEIIVLRTRLMPFKTKMIYDYKMDWGLKYPKSDYPEREKQPLSLFNIKTFVEKQKEERINQMLNGMNPNAMPNMPMNGMPSFPTVPPMAPPAPTVPPMGGNFNVDDLVKRIDAKIAELEEEERREKLEQEKALSGDLQSVEEPKEELPEVALEKPVLEQLEETPAQPVVPPFFNFMQPKEEKKEDIIPPLPIEREEKKVVVKRHEEVIEREYVPSSPIGLEKHVEDIIPKQKHEITDDEFFDDFFSDEE